MPGESEENHKILKFSLIKCFLLKLVHIIALITMTIVFPAAEAGAYNPRITQVIVTNNQKFIVLFASLEAAFDANILAALKNGLPFQFEYDLQIFRERRLWPDRLISPIKLTHTLKYDILKEQFIFTAVHGGSEIRKISKNLSEVQHWMSTIDGAEIIPMDILGSGRRYFLRMRVKIVSAQDFFSRNIFFFFRKDGQHRTEWYRSPLFSITGQRRP